MELFVVKLNQRGPTRTGQSASEGDATSPSSPAIPKLWPATDMQRRAWDWRVSVEREEQRTENM